MLSSAQSKNLKMSCENYKDNKRKNHKDNKHHMLTRPTDMQIGKQMSKERATDRLEKSATLSRETKATLDDNFSQTGKPESFTNGIGKLLNIHNMNLDAQKQKTPKLSEAIEEKTEVNFDEDDEILTPESFLRKSPKFQQKMIDNFYNDRVDAFYGTQIGAAHRTILKQLKKQGSAGGFVSITDATASVNLDAGDSGDLQRYFERFTSQEEWQKTVLAHQQSMTQLDLKNIENFDIYSILRGIASANETYGPECLKFLKKMVVKIYQITFLNSIASTNWVFAMENLSETAKSAVDPKRAVYEMSGGRKNLFDFDSLRVTNPPPTDRGFFEIPDVLLLSAELDEANEKMEELTTELMLLFWINMGLLQKMTFLDFRDALDGTGRDPIYVADVLDKMEFPNINSRILWIDSEEENEEEENTEISESEISELQSEESSEFLDEENEKNYFKQAVDAEFEKMADDLFVECELAYGFDLVADIFYSSQEHFDLEKLKANGEVWATYEKYQSFSKMGPEEKLKTLVQMFAILKVVTDVYDSARKVESVDSTGTIPIGVKYFRKLNTLDAKDPDFIKFIGVLDEIKTEEAGARVKTILEAFNKNINMYVNENVFRLNIKERTSLNYDLEDLNFMVMWNMVRKYVSDDANTNAMLVNHLRNLDNLARLSTESSDEFKNKMEKIKKKFSGTYFDTTLNLVLVKRLMVRFEEFHSKMMEKQEPENTDETSFQNMYAKRKEKGEFRGRPALMQKEILEKFFSTISWEGRNFSLNKLLNYLVTDSKMQLTLESASGPVMSNEESSASILGAKTHTSNARWNFDIISKIPYVLSAVVGIALPIVTTSLVLPVISEYISLPEYSTPIVAGMSLFNFASRSIAGSESTTLETSLPNITETNRTSANVLPFPKKKMLLQSFSAGFQSVEIMQEDGQPAKLNIPKTLLPDNFVPVRNNQPLKNVDIFQILGFDSKKIEKANPKITSTIAYLRDMTESLSTHSNFVLDRITMDVSLSVETKERLLKMFDRLDDAQRILDSLQRDYDKTSKTDYNDFSFLYFVITPILRISNYLETYLIEYSSRNPNIATSTTAQKFELLELQIVRNFNSLFETTNAPPIKDGVNKLFQNFLKNISEDGKLAREYTERLTANQSYYRKTDALAALCGANVTNYVPTMQDDFTESEKEMFRTICSKSDASGGLNVKNFGFWGRYKNMISENFSFANFENWSDFFSGLLTPFFSSGIVAGMEKAHEIFVFGNTAGDKIAVDQNEKNRESFVRKLTTVFQKAGGLLPKIRGTILVASHYMSTAVLLSSMSSQILSGSYLSTATMATVGASLLSLKYFGSHKSYYLQNKIRDSMISSVVTDYANRNIMPESVASFFNCEFLTPFMHAVLSAGVLAGAYDGFTAVAGAISILEIVSQELYTKTEVFSQVLEERLNKNPSEIMDFFKKENTESSITKLALLTLSEKDRITLQSLNDENMSSVSAGDVIKLREKIASHSRFYYGLMALTKILSVTKYLVAPGNLGSAITEGNSDLEVKKAFIDLSTKMESKLWNTYFGGNVVTDFTKMGGDSISGVERFSNLSDKILKGIYMVVPDINSAEASIVTLDNGVRSVMMTGLGVTTINNLWSVVTDAVKIVKISSDVDQEEKKLDVG